MRLTYWILAIAVVLTPYVTHVQLTCKAESQFSRKPAAVEEYRVHEDGGLVYDPLRREAEKTGQLELYRDTATGWRKLELGAYRLRYRVPKRAGAYHVIPIEYALSWEAGEKVGRPDFPVAVEATAFETPQGRRDKNCFDLALPGRVDLDVEFLGSITAHLKPGRRHNLKADLSDKPGDYPPFIRKPFVRSGVVEGGDLVWFKFRYTNTGETILDPEGFGGCQLWPRLLRKNAAGKYAAVGEPYNMYARDLEYLYPGQSHEIWLHCTGNMPGYGKSPKNPTPQGFGLTPGQYKYSFRMTYRSYKTDAPFLNIWDGPLLFNWEMPFVIEEKPRQTPVANGRKLLTDGGERRKITRFIHTLEEFMTAFDCHQRPPADGQRTIEGRLHLQVAPWTTQVVVKLIDAEAVTMASSISPISVDGEKLKVTFQPESQACLTRDGMREPLIASQSMADMRANVQLGPFVEKHIRDRLREMMDCGINLVSTTSMPWLYDDRNEPKSNYQGDAYKYFLDVARKEGICVEGWGAYPFDRAAIEEIATWITGKEFRIARSGVGLSLADPQLTEANAAAWLYQFRRWGDLYYQHENGDVPISVEDTRGWMRQDVNVRHPMGQRVIAAFRDWLAQKYGTIEKVNRAWGTSFSSFAQVDPEKDQVVNRFGHRLEYTNRQHPFHDWNRAVADLDAFRTELRVKNYLDTLELVRKEIPEAVVCLRTEGANVLVGGLDPNHPNAHYRHIYYSQRRCAAIAEILQASGLIGYHTDYDTMPYTPSELRELVPQAVRQGIMPIYLAQFDNMRDIAINQRYGTDYQIHYNLPEPKKGYMMHCLTALYPWFQAVYESGGVPGILWEDYQCDGFATETQKREMRLFREKLQEAISTPAARRLRSERVRKPSQDWRKGSQALPSYRLD